jgi:hypothetical protein
VYHSIPPVIAKPNEKPRFVQLYVIDNAEDSLARDSNIGLNPTYLHKLLEHLQLYNPWAQAIKYHARNFLLYQPEIPTIHLKFENSSTITDKQFQAPTVDEIAGFVPSDSMDFDAFRSIQLNNANGTFSCINELNASYDPTHYVLMFPHGERGYSIDMHGQVSMQRFYQQ